ncbi:MAG: hypothetical protein MJ154_01470 [Candidatus Saccharibacteria bacterium]|nr:hypothetical protein [Candidatus Saccharibacteria bacterium]
MSETSPKNNPEDIKNEATQWEGLQDPSAQAESQESAEKTTSEETLQKIGKNAGLAAEMSAGVEAPAEAPDTPEEAPQEAADTVDIDAEDTKSKLEQQKSHPYERTIQGPDGMIHHIEAETQEEFDDKLEDLREYYKELYG